MTQLIDDAVKRAVKAERLTAFRAEGARPAGCSRRRVTAGGGRA